MTIPGGGSGNMGKFCAVASDGVHYWYPAVVAESGSSWSEIAQTFYGNGDLCYAQWLSYKNTGDYNATLDVGQVVGLPGGLGPCGGVDIGIDCTQVPPQDTLAVVTAPPGFYLHQPGVCGFTTC